MTQHDTTIPAHRLPARTRPAPGTRPALPPQAARILPPGRPTLAPTLALALACAAVLMLAQPAVPQVTAPAADATQDAGAFAPENAVINTAIPFAIGAREARQNLRGSFGWPTFQEGLVDGVYFRFDPDGYARFAPTPRLDTDVFEVICRPRTLTCIGRKGTLTLLLNARGQLQLQIEGVAQGDRFFVAEGVTEVELPATILQPLEPQMELLLAAGGDLIVRRGEVEVDRVSLTGFYPVGAYLRWVASGQDYAVLPRNWPVPAGVPADTVTQALNWPTQVPQPQAFPVTPVNDTAPADDTARTEVAEVRGELRLLRELLLAREAASRGGDVTPASTNPAANPAADPAADTAVANRISQLQEAAEQIRRDIARLQDTPDPAVTPTTPTTPNGQQRANSDLAAVAASLGLTVPNPQITPPGGLTQTRLPAAPAQNPALNPALRTPPAQTQNDTRQTMAARLNYLITEIGLDPKTAVTLLELAENPETKNQTTEIRIPDQNDPLVENILNELEAEIQTTQPKTQNSNIKTQNKPETYNLIAQFLKNTINE